MIWLQTAVLLLAAPGLGDAVLLDFHTDGCMPCRQMAPAVDHLIAQGYPVRRINGGHDPAAAARYSVNAFPTFVLVANGRVVDRVVGATSYDRLEQMFQKARAMNVGNTTPPAPAAMPSESGGEGTLPAVASGPLGSEPAMPMVSVSVSPGGAAASSPSGWATVSPAAAGPTTDIRINPGIVRAATTTVSTPSPTAAPAAASPMTNAQLIAATVRLRIEDPSGHSCGTGTIIDTRDGWALILTCGHLFRDAKKDHPVIDVDLFGPTGPRRVAGELVSFDSEKRDLGLVRIRVPGQVCIAPVAPADYKIEIGAPVAAVGCSHGADPTVQRSRVRAKNKFLGPPNLQVDGQPVEGRSGGGLFSAEGYLIGVCNAADPTDNAGLFAALASIHSELDRVNLSYVYQHPSGQPSGRWSPLPTMPGGDLVAVGPPTMPHHMPAPTAMDTATTGGPVPTSSRQESPCAFASPGGGPPLTPAETAALEEIRRRKAEGAEVICIIRSPNDPTGKSEILRLENASPAFLQQLATETTSGNGQPIR
ncbi:MAG: trypsin-like peptidase domain-containing protein [Pirellulales bacterium]|nr:trypsin-like peptidase domain-containing protein [Pirellulales bacterium]